MKNLGLSHRPAIGPVPGGLWKVLGLRPGMESRPGPKGLRITPGLGRARTGAVRRSLLTALGLRPHAADSGKPLGLISGFGPRPVGLGLRTPRGLRVTPGLRPSPLERMAPHGWPAGFLLKLRERMPTLATSQPRPWLEAARERLATLRRG
ncbi:MAG: hypothetical protein K5Q68_07900 [Roseococcus sp.]|nr:hypothetical protein [Roseococcus sp.]